MEINNIKLDRETLKRLITKKNLTLVFWAVVIVCVNISYGSEVFKEDMSLKEELTQGDKAIKKCWDNDFNNAEECAKINSHSPAMKCFYKCARKFEDKK